MTLSVAIVGVGLVGSEFVKQTLPLVKSHVIRIVGLSTSKKSLFAASGLDVVEADWKTALSSSVIAASPESLLGNLGKLVDDGEKTVLIDNTSSDDIAALYPRFLRAGISIITPNKKAYSSSLSLYYDILSASTKTGARILNEATVGAGLPIISTLRDLVATGDNVRKIEGVLSGTLSYIFNEFSTVQGTGPSFSSVVKIAREKGYTEPHPGDDLNGADVARKLTILSRLIPSLKDKLAEGYKSVSTTSLVPKELEGLSGDDFVSRLAGFDSHFEELRASAKKENKVLRYVGVINAETNEIKASLEKYPADHPFATSLGGSDNIIAFHTERYGARPLIVQGAGAGAAVTAMGVLSDTLRLLD
ncbi:hypothetical protein SISSUDRAFT_1025519 [Sistotremastrum suecicum HHB10207 ss-3]|uniref:Homoserine dehydrogenase n=1 Tax=Sistotremastrum suecicum HHB10207 ss-3 TaxID=1314776 RepID=A0A166AJG7_9AGAM|nr:hypothetical protein SISSUDRAFT_1025519 [Sistotremastrum suecicum HHB10207 ss-3]